MATEAYYPFESGSDSVSVKESADIGQRQPEVQASLTQLRNKVNLLEERLGGLASRLGPVLRRLSSAQEDAEPEDPHVPNSPPLVLEIDSITEQVQGLVAVADDLLDRLEV